MKVSRLFVSISRPIGDRDRDRRTKPGEESGARTQASAAPGSRVGQHGSRRFPSEHCCKVYRVPSTRTDKHLKEGTPEWRATPLRHSSHTWRERCRLLGLNEVVCRKRERGVDLSFWVGRRRRALLHEPARRAILPCHRGGHQGYCVQDLHLWARNGGRRSAGQCGRPAHSLRARPSGRHGGDAIPRLSR